MRPTYIIEVTENDIKLNPETVYVRAKEYTIDKRQYEGGFRRFLYAFYDFAENYPIGCTINGKPILNVSQFDKWRRKHEC